VWVYSHLFQPIVNPAFGSLVYSLVFVLVCWLVVLPLYRKRIFLKL
jgi:predicted acyltransferase